MTDETRGQAKREAETEAREPALARAKREHEHDEAVIERQERARQAILDDAPGRRMQWVGMFLAPAAFFLHLQVGYILVPWGCVQRTTLWIHVVGILSILLAIAGMAAAWVTWRGADPNGPDDAGGVYPRTRFMGISGLGTSALLALILFWQWVAVFFINPCQ